MRQREPNKPNGIRRRTFVKRILKGAIGAGLGTSLYHIGGRNESIAYWKITLEEKGVREAETWARITTPLITYRKRDFRLTPEKIHAMNTITTIAKTINWGKELSTASAIKRVLQTLRTNEREIRENGPLALKERLENKASVPGTDESVKNTYYRIIDIVDEYAKQPKNIQEEMMRLAIN